MKALSLSIQKLKPRLSFFFKSQGQDHNDKMFGTNEKFFAKGILCNMKDLIISVGLNVMAKVKFFFFKSR